jgi:fumarate hydratase class I
MKEKKDLVQAIVELYKLTSIFLPSDIKKEIRKTKEKEDSFLAKKVMESIEENIEIAEQKGIPLCEDTGIPVFFVEIPKGFSQNKIKKAILKATEIAAKKNYLRPNAVDSLTQKNSGNCIGEGIPTIYFNESRSEWIKFNLLLKGGGSENVGRTYSLPDATLKAGRDLNGIKKCVLDAVIKAQGLGCPPSIISVVVGGSKDAIAVESKKQLLQPLNKKNEKKNKIREFEKELLKEINSLGIGPMGLSGKTTAFNVKVKFLARHPASFFVEVCFCCWADRRHSLKWKKGKAIYK